MKSLALIFTLIILTCLGVPALAQGGDTTIEYGQSVTGEITNQAFEVPYVFQGAAGDIIVAEMSAVEVLGDLSMPSIILLDTDFNMLSSVYGFNSAVLAAKLPADGTYNLLATRNNGRAGDSLGEYTLSLLKPQVLVADEAVSSSLTNETVDYFVIEAEGPFSLHYEKQTGNFYPATTIHVISDGELDEAAALQGEELSSGVLGLEGKSDSYIVTVGEALWDFNFFTVSAEYTLTLTP